MLFDRLSLLSDDSGSLRVVGIEAASLSVHLLQYLVEGRLNTPAEALSLNKVLCGLPPDASVGSSLTPDPADVAVRDQLLQAVVANWQSIGRSSVAALHKTLLQREGSLSLTNNQWELRVQRNTFDILMDGMPWKISLVTESWMSTPLHVDWA